MIKTVIGDILDATEDIICHQVNCRGVMGAGVAKTLCTRWPIIKKTYIRYCRRFENQNELLGHVLSVEVEPNKTVLNILGSLIMAETSTASTRIMLLSQKHLMRSAVSIITNRLHSHMDLVAG